jgi:hypothetical protein
MAERNLPKELAARDRLVTRPDRPLPTPRDPRVRGFPADPKSKPPRGQGTDPHAADLDHTV